MVLMNTHFAAYSWKGRATAGASWNHIWVHNTEASRYCRHLTSPYWLYLRNSVRTIHYISIEFFVIQLKPESMHIMWLKWEVNWCGGSVLKNRLQDNRETMIESRACSQKIRIEDTPVPRISFILLITVHPEDSAVKRGRGDSHWSSITSLGPMQLTAQLRRGKLRSMIEITHEVVELWFRAVVFNFLNLTIQG
jgi:hypothetical protein